MACCHRCCWLFFCFDFYLVLSRRGDVWPHRADLPGDAVPHQGGDGACAPSPDGRRLGGGRIPRRRTRLPLLRLWGKERAEGGRSGARPCGCTIQREGAWCPPLAGGWGGGGRRPATGALVSPAAAHLGGLVDHKGNGSDQAGRGGTSRRRGHALAAPIAATAATSVHWGGRPNWPKRSIICGADGGSRVCFAQRALRCTTTYRDAQVLNQLIKQTTSVFS